MIYLVQQQDSKNFKIGYVSRNPYKRLDSLQVSNHSLLTIVGLIEGEMKEEKELHKHFKYFHIRGEWFTYDDSILNYFNTHPNKIKTLGLDEYPVEREKSSDYYERLVPKYNILPSWDLLLTIVRLKANDKAVALFMAAQSEICSDSLKPLHLKVFKHETITCDIIQQIDMNRASVENSIDKLCRYDILYKCNQWKDGGRKDKQWVFNPYLTFHSKNISKDTCTVFDSSNFAKVMKANYMQ